MYLLNTKKKKKSLPRCHSQNVTLTLERPHGVCSGTYHVLFRSLSFISFTKNIFSLHLYLSILNFIHLLKDYYYFLRSFLLI